MLLAEEGPRTWKEVVMMTRFRWSLSGRFLLKGAIAVALIFGAASQLATPAAADDGSWWRHHRYGDHGRFYGYPGPRYYYGPPAYYYPAPPPPPAY
jgi:hypothetical protein